MKVYKIKLEAALDYASRDIPVFPLKPEGNRKIPAVKWKDGQTTDPEQIAKWWADNPDYEIALVTGEKSGIAVVDLDTSEAWSLINQRGLPNGPVVKTGKGYHVYCKHEDGVRNFQKRADLPGIDLRGEGGYVVAPPSVHEFGAIYAWVDGKSLDDFQELPPIPEWILARNKDDKQPISELLEGVGEGERNIALTRLVGHWLQERTPYQQIVKNALDWNQKNKPPEDNIAKVMTTINSICKRPDEQVVADEWEDPILDDLIETPEITANLLPSWLGQYALEVTKENQTPESLAVMTCLPTIATAVQKKFEVQAFPNSYIEPLSIWTITVLGPSERKTPVLNAMTAPLVQWASEQKVLLEANYYLNKTTRDVALKRIEKLKSDASKETDPGKRSALIMLAVEAEREMPDEMIYPKLCTSTITAEQMEDLLSKNGERMSVISDEGGIFSIMTGMYNSKSDTNIDIFLKGYSGSPHISDRRTRNADLKRPAISFGLTVQPSVIESFGSNNQKGLRGKGALARFLFCIPRPRIGTRDAYQTYCMPPMVRENYMKRVKELLDVTSQIDELGCEIPRMMTLGADALAVHLKFATDVEKRLGVGGDLNMLADWGGKLPGNALRIASILNLVEHGPTVLIVSKENVERAIEMCKRLIGHAKKAFGLIGTDDAVILSKKVLHWMLENKQNKFTKSACQRALHGSFTRVEELNKALEVLIERFIIRKDRVKTGGRPSDTFFLSNKLCK